VSKDLPGSTAHDADHQLTAAVILLARNAPEPVRGRLAGRRPGSSATTASRRI
jgi:hypothetical protein